MEISEDRTRQLARLARLALTQKEVTQFTSELCDILDYVDALKEVDVEGVEPTTHAVALAVALREDAAQRVFTHEQILQNAPDTEDGMFRVPKVVG